MALIAGTVPPRDPRFSSLPRNVVVKLRPGGDHISNMIASAHHTPEAFGALLGAVFGSHWHQFHDHSSHFTIRPYFEAGHDELLEAHPTALSPLSNQRVATAPRYLVVGCPPDIAPAAVAELLRGLPHVETAYAEAGPTPPPVDRLDDLLSAHQGYLDSAPDGIDALAMWALGVEGAGIGFVDLEQGWIVDHEDLAEASIALVSGTNAAYHGHGAATVGQVVAVDNDRGIVGIAPGATARVVSQWRPNGSYNTADAILGATGVMRPGDVLLLEAQTEIVNTGQRAPVEIEEAVYDAIVSATRQGIVVVEPAGNGSMVLDEFVDVRGRQILNRTSADFRDSGAIVVAAATSGASHAPIPVSNIGSRVDCYAWGEHIVTCGDGWTGTQPNVYTSTFGGTSGAAAIVAGAAVLLQAWRTHSGLERYSPSQMRALFSDPNNNTPSRAPAVDRIGVMPNLRAIVQSEGAQ
jgi:hypothetical protein